MLSVSYVPDSRFYGRRWWRFWRPRRLTLRLPDWPGVYRWLVWNFMWEGGKDA